MKSICLIYTGPGVRMVGEGYNLGRKYCIAADFPMDIHEGKAKERMRGIGQHVTDGKLRTCGDFVKFLEVLVSQAKTRHKPHFQFLCPQSIKPKTDSTAFYRLKSSTNTRAINLPVLENC